MPKIILTLTDLTGDTPNILSSSDVSDVSQFELFSKEWWYEVVECCDIDTNWVTDLLNVSSQDASATVFTTSQCEVLATVVFCLA